MLAGAAEPGAEGAAAPLGKILWGRGGNAPLADEP